MTDIPPAALRARQMYIESAPTRKILAETGLSHWALYHWIDGGPKIDGKRLLPALPRRGVIVRRRIHKAERTALVTRMMRAAELQVAEIELRLAQDGHAPSDRERDARLMAVCVNTLRELTALNALHDSGPPQTDSAEDDYDAIPRELDELRRELSRRLEAMAAGNTGGVSGKAEGYGVNSGPGRAAKVLHRLLGLPDQAGMSERVIAAARSAIARDLILRLCEERLAFLRSLRTWPVFGAGWSRRVREVKTAALIMANHAPNMDTPVIPPPPDIPSPSISPGRDIAPTASRTGAGIIAAILSLLATFRKQK